MLNKEKFSTKIKEVLQTIGAGIFGISVIALGIGFGGSTAMVMPDYAYVYVDVDTMHYFAPFCVPPEADWDYMTAREARMLKFTPDPDCRDQGFFVQDGRTIIGSYLERWGMLPETKLRWDEDGSWHW